MKRPNHAPCSALLVAACLCAGLVACHEADSTGNVLIVLVDDIGPELLAAYGEGDDPPPTPNIDRLAAEGVLFRNAWANPLCSPTRALLMTGRYAFRTGVGSVINPTTAALPLEEITLPELVERARPGAVAHAAFGKWHLGNASVGGVESPNLAGWGHFAGTLGNLVGDYSYERYDSVVDGRVIPRRSYATSDTVDDALAWIGAADEPWLVYVAFHAAHAKFHAPPEHLFTVDLSQAGPPDTDPRPYYRAMIEALDTELGRLLDGLGEARSRTTVIFLADNGTTPHVARDELAARQSKGSLFEGGLRVPFIVAGAGVGAPGRTSHALVSAVDVFATTCELLGFDAESALPSGHPVDSVSLVPELADAAAPPARQLLFAEVFEPNGFAPRSGMQAVRGQRYKLISDISGAGEALLDLESDPTESENLLGRPELGPQARKALARLRRGLYDLRADR